MTYVDGFVAAVPTSNREIYKKHAEAAAVVFKEHGALKLVEGPARTWAAKLPEGIPRLEERLSFMRVPINTLQLFLQQVEDIGGTEPSPIGPSRSEVQLF
jgi:hypothetical protein